MRSDRSVERGKTPPTAAGERATHAAIRFSEKVPFWMRHSMSSVLSNGAWLMSIRLMARYDTQKDT
jgi:hypothetical protein